MNKHLTKKEFFDSIGAKGMTEGQLKIEFYMFYRKYIDLVNQYESLHSFTQELQSALTQSQNREEK